MAKNLILGQILTHFAPNLVLKNFLLLLDVIHCCKLSLYAISRKTNNPHFGLVSGLILDHLAQIRISNFFFKNLTPTVTRYHGQLLSCTISEETNDTILRKLRNGRTVGQTGRQRQMDESDFIGRCPTNVERPIKEKFKSLLACERLIRWIKIVHSLHSLKENCLLNQNSIFVK